MYPSHCLLKWVIISMVILRAPIREGCSNRLYLIFKTKNSSSGETYVLRQRGAD